MTGSPTSDEWDDEAWGNANFSPLVKPMPGDWARGRRTEFNYFYKSFPLGRWWGEDAGQPGRFVYQVHDGPYGHESDVAPAVDWEEMVLDEDEGRRQVRILVGREMGRVLEVRFERVSAAGDPKKLFRLQGEDCARFVELVRSLDYLPVDGAKDTQRLSGELLRRAFTDPETSRAAYEQSPEVFAQLISSNVKAKDVIALANRQEQVEIFRRLLEDPDFFTARRAEVAARGPEDVWQKFFEANPWILGVGLSGQLLTSFHPEKLEQLVVGASVTKSGKRTDALMATVGAINSLVFAEIKHHDTDLLHQITHPYRPAVWAPSPELAGGVTQIQQTVHLARDAFEEQVLRRDAAGRQTGESVFFIRPRCYLIVGHLSEIARNGAIDPDKFRSFELYRRNLYEPEIITFDELLARAEWHLAQAEREVGSGD